MFKNKLILTKMEIINDDVVINYDTLVLSGGSSKGIIILGALQYAYDNFLLNKVTNYIGTSIGAIICYLLAIGYTPIEIVIYICTNQLFEKIQHFNIVAMINGVGAISFNNIYEHLEKMTIEKLGYIPTFLDYNKLAIDNKIIRNDQNVRKYHLNNIFEELKNNKLEKQKKNKLFIL